MVVLILLAAILSSAFIRDSSSGELMSRFLTPFAGSGGNGAKAYQCSNCGSLITSSDRLLAVSGNHHHLFVNPAGLECRLYTFDSCPGTIATGIPTEEDSWFEGYGWHLAFCRVCGLHLGWHYEAASAEVRPLEFWGILITQLVAR
jgi:hypothetical protein